MVLKTLVFKFLVLLISLALVVCALEIRESNAAQTAPSNSSVSLVKSNSGWDPSVVIPLLYPNRPLSSILLNPPSSDSSIPPSSESSFQSPPPFNPNQVAKAWMYKCSIPILDNPSPEEFWNVAVQGEQPVVLRHVNNNAVFRRLTTRNNLLEMYGNSTIILSTSNTASYRKSTSTLKDYIDTMMKPHTLDEEGDKTFYHFGDNNYQEWDPLFARYRKPQSQLLELAQLHYEDIKLGRSINQKTLPSSSSSSPASSDSQKAMLADSQPPSSLSSNNKNSNDNMNQCDWDPAANPSAAPLPPSSLSSLKTGLFDPRAVEDLKKEEEEISAGSASSDEIWQEGEEEWEAQEVQPDGTALSFGLGGSGSGVPFHTHGPVFAEVLHGLKMWFFYPAGHRPPFEGNVTSLRWFDEVYPTMESDPLFSECTLGPGDVLYLPDGWFHSTLNIGESVFMSVFL